MDYLVLARKLRPNRFADLIGQETVAQILRNAVRTDRIAHAFLFTGSRGVGKTSAARILTKLWNCLNPQDTEPCNTCSNCIEITSNASTDVMEIDAASNRGIDNIRELRENVKFAPAKCRYKTYIIDEVHMLTVESFNALLKTLEEPPPHVKMILATTSPHKIPDTILSRCQRFDFSRIPLKTMVDYLSQVTEQEGITISRRSLEAISRNSAGGMRDALTALDQVVAFCGMEVAEDQLHTILGLMDTGIVLELLGAVLDRDLESALRGFTKVLDHGHDPLVLLETTLRNLKDLTLYGTLGKQDPYFQDHTPETLTFYQQRSQDLNLDHAQQLFQLFLELEQQIQRSQFATACFEMALVKATRVESLVGVPELLARVRTAISHLPPGPTDAGPKPRPGGASNGPGNTGARHPAGGASATPASTPTSASGKPPTPHTGTTSPSGEPPTEPSAEQPAPAKPTPHPNNSRAGETADSRAINSTVSSGTGSDSRISNNGAINNTDNTNSADSRTAHGETIPRATPSPAPAATAPTADLSEADNSTAPPTDQAEQGAAEPATQSDTAQTRPANSAPPDPAKASPQHNTAQSDTAQTRPANSAPPEDKPPDKAPDSPLKGKPPDKPPDKPSANPHSADPRWQAFVTAVHEVGAPQLTAHLRRAEVINIDQDTVKIAPADALAREQLLARLETLTGPLEQAFGSAFRIQIDHDTSRTARSGSSLLDREREEAEAYRTALHQEALADQRVRQIQQFFPQSQIETVKLPPSLGNEGRDVR